MSEDPRQTTVPREVLDTLTKLDEQLCAMGVVGPSDPHWELHVALGAVHGRVRNALDDAYRWGLLP